MSKSVTVKVQFILLGLPSISAGEKYVCKFENLAVKIIFNAF